jgi:hypothetical protein
LSYIAIRVRARRALARNIHAIAVFALAKCIAPCAAAEEPPPRADPADSSVKSEPATEPAQAPASSSKEVSGADAPEAQVPVQENSEPTPSTQALVFDAPPATKSVPVSERKVPHVLGVRVPAFIALSLGGLEAGGAVVTRLVANWPSAEPKSGCVAHCSEGSHTLETTSAILTGIAVASVGTGLVLALSDPGKARKRLAMAPVLGMSVSSHKAAASASWRF